MLSSVRHLREVSRQAPCRETRKTASPAGFVQAALVAIAREGPARARYRSLRERLVPKAALIALACKLLRIAWARLRHQSIMMPLRHFHRPCQWRRKMVVIPWRLGRGRGIPPFGHVWALSSRATRDPASLRIRSPRLHTERPHPEHRTIRAE